MDKLDRLLSVEDLAAYLGVPLATIYAWRYRRQGPPGFRVGRHLRFRERDIEEWIGNQLRESHSDRSGMAGPRRL
jgi:excisionase family DNA binding protein